MLRSRSPYTCIGDSTGDLRHFAMTVSCAAQYAGSTSGAFFLQLQHHFASGCEFRPGKKNYRFINQNFRQNSGGQNDSFFKSLYPLYVGLRAIPLRNGRCCNVPYMASSMTGSHLAHCCELLARSSLYLSLSHSLSLFLSLCLFLFFLSFGALSVWQRRDSRSAECWWPHHEHTPRFTLRDRSLGICKEYKKKKKETNKKDGRSRSTVPVDQGQSEPEEVFQLQACEVMRLPCCCLKLAACKSMKQTYYVFHLRAFLVALPTNPPESMFPYSLIQEWSGRVFWYAVWRHYANGLELARVSKNALPKNI